MWGTLKDNIKRVYGHIPNENFILFLREAEFRYKLRKLNNEEKEKEVIEVFQYIYNSCNFELYDIDELIDNNN